MDNIKSVKDMLIQKKYKTLDEYIDMAEKLNIALAVADLREIERVLKEEGQQCNEKN